MRRRAATAAPYTTAYTAFGVKCLVAPEVPNNAGSLAPITVSAPEGSQLSEAGRGIFSEAEAICLTCSGVWVRARCSRTAQDRPCSGAVAIPFPNRPALSEVEQRRRKRHRW